MVSSFLDTEDLKVCKNCIRCIFCVQKRAKCTFIGNGLNAKLMYKAPRPTLLILEAVYVTARNVKLTFGPKLLLIFKRFQNQFSCPYFDPKYIRQPNRFSRLDDRDGYTNRYLYITVTQTFYTKHCGVGRYPKTVIFAINSKLIFVRSLYFLFMYFIIFGYMRVSNIHPKCNKDCKTLYLTFIGWQRNL